MEKINQLMKNLDKNNIKAFYVKDKEEGLNLIKSLLKDGEKLTVGGSKTLREMGLLDHLASGRYQYLDRYDKSLDKESIYREAFTCDTYITSTNALIMDGQLFNVDAVGNRVSALVFGTQQVIVVAGVNKIVEDVGSAILRVKEVAAPLNCKRLGADTYCAEHGVCISTKNPETKYLLGAGCDSVDRICCSYLLTSYQMNKYRIKVIIVGEDLGN